VCSRCDTLTDIPAALFTPVLDAARQATRFHIPPAGVTITGLCPTCQTTATPAADLSSRASAYRMG
jgi:Fe2+ or Zn2+ uptake regulation protein